jgi:hypothetical protein
MVHSPAGDIQKILTVTDQQGDQQCRSAVIQVGRPDHLIALPKSQDAGNEVQQGRFVVGNFLREQTVSVGVDHNAVMMGFAGIDACPQLRQNSLQSVVRVEPGR